MKRLFISVVVSVTLTGCVTFVFNPTGYEPSKHYDPHFDEHYIPFDSARFQKTLLGETQNEDEDLQIMEVSADDLKDNMSGRAYWVAFDYYGCGAPYKLINTLNQLADSVDTPIISVSLLYDYNRISFLHDTLQFHNPPMVLSNSSYPDGTDKNKKRFYNQMTDAKYPKDAFYTFLIDSKGDFRGFLSPNGTFQPHSPEGEPIERDLKTSEETSLKK